LARDSMVGLGIRESDQIRRDYEARMHARIQQTAEEERQRAAQQVNQIEQITKEECKELQNGIQHAVARNYRIRQSHENEINKLLIVVDEDRKAAALRERQFEESLCELRDDKATLAAENGRLSTDVERLRKEAVSLHSFLDQANADLLKAEEETRAQNSLLTGNIHQLEEAAARNKSQMEAKLKQAVDKAVVEREAALAEKQRLLDAASANTAKLVADAKAAANADYSKALAEMQRKAQALMEAYETQEAEAKAAADATVKQLEEEKAELGHQLRQLANTEDERAQTWKNHEAMLMFELAGARKAQELAELKNSETELKLEKVIKEAETMRRVFEASLKEADSVASMLKEQLQIVRNAMREQAVVSDQEMQKKLQELDTVLAEKSGVELEKYEKEAAMRLELHSLQLTAEELQLSKEQVVAQLRLEQNDSQRSKEALAASLKEAEVLQAELLATERKCDSITRESEVKCRVTEHKKVVAVEEANAKAAHAAARANEAEERRRLADEKLKATQLSLSRSKYELGLALKDSQRLRFEQDEAEVVLELLDGTLGEVRASHREIVHEADEIAAAAENDLASSLAASRGVTALTASALLS